VAVIDDMNADFLAVIEYWEKEKGISRDVLTSAVQEALLSAAKKAVGPARELRVAIEPKTGDIRAFAKLIVSDKVISKHDQISTFEARRLKPDAQVGDEVEKEVTPTGFGRIAAQTPSRRSCNSFAKRKKFSSSPNSRTALVTSSVERFDALIART
jgi:NusA N-terminal domain.